MPVTVFQDLRARRARPNPDARLWPAAAAAGRGDFSKNLAAAIPALRAFARSLCGDRTLADDLVQETLLKAWTARSTFEDGRSLKSWTFTILHNVFHSAWRTARRTLPMDSAIPALEARAGENPYATLELADVACAMARLPVNQQEALILIAAGGFTYGEAAEITGVALGTVKSRVFRARQTLAGLNPSG